MMMRSSILSADLHIHSLISDGNVSKEDIFLQAQQQGVRYIALAEHDTFEGMDRNFELGEIHGVKVIPAIEISAFHSKSRKKVHILGYGIKDTSYVEALCTPLLERRHENSLRQIEVLKEKGYRIVDEHILAYTHRYLYKQHICDYLYQTKQIDSILGDFYQMMFKNDGPCSFDIEYIEAVEALAAIHQGGGIGIVAHPGEHQNYEAIDDLIGHGLDGLELYHPAHTFYDVEHIREICESHELLATGGSDFHGTYTHRPSDLFTFGLTEDELEKFLAKINI